jgi:hypothetical protein
MPRSYPPEFRQRVWNPGVQRHRHHVDLSGCRSPGLLGGLSLWVGLSIDEVSVISTTTFSGLVLNTRRGKNGSLVNLSARRKEAAPLSWSESVSAEGCRTGRSPGISRGSLASSRATA